MANVTSLPPSTSTLSFDTRNQRNGEDPGNYVAETSNFPTSVGTCTFTGALVNPSFFSHDFTNSFFVTEFYDWDAPEIPLRRCYHYFPPYLAFSHPSGVDRNEAGTLFTATDAKGGSRQDNESFIGWGAGWHR